MDVGPKAFADREGGIFMKRLIAYFICGILLVLPIQVLASQSDADGFEAIQQAVEFDDLSRQEETIVEHVNEILNTEYGNDSHQITQEDINWDRAYKLYIDADIYAEQSDNTQQILEFLQNQQYIWQLPISKDGLDLIVEFSESPPLSDEAKEILTAEQQAERIRDEGKFTISCVSVGCEIPSYKERLLELLEDYHIQAEQKILFGGMPKMRSVSGIALNGQGVETVIPLEQPRLAGTPQYRSRSGGLTGIERDKAYSFDQMAQTLNAVPQPVADGVTVGAGAAGQNQFDPLILVLIGGCALAIGAVIVYVKKCR